MRVLLPAVDIYNSIGGGQSFYKQIIEANPNIEFNYLIRSESENSSKPFNAKSIKYELKFRNMDFPDPSNYFKSIPSWCRHAVSNAANIAYSARNLKFDVIDIPDWEQYGCFLRFFCNHFNIDFKKMILSMHGTISSTIYRHWKNTDKDYSSLEFLEKNQYLSCDVRYGISNFYIDEWEQRTNLRAEYLHPFNFFCPKKMEPFNKTTEIPSLVFFGRTEKRKGPDFFINLAWAMQKERFKQGTIIGPSVPLENKTTSTDILNALITKRNINIDIKNDISQIEMQDYFHKSNLIVLPSRYDTFNLVALESIFAGCPIVIGKNTGVVGFLKKEFPYLPVSVLPMDDFSACIKVLEDAIDNYQENRQQIYNTLHNFDTKNHNSKSLLSIYQQHSNRVLENNFYFDEIAKLFLEQASAHPFDPSEINAIFKPKPLSWKQRVKNEIKRLGKHRNYKNLSGIQKAVFSITGFLPRIARKLIRSKNRPAWFKMLSERFSVYLTLSECGKENIIIKLKTLYSLIHNYPFGKVAIYSKMARLQFFFNNPIIASTYFIRSARLGSNPNPNAFKYFLEILSANKFSIEADTAKLLYDNTSNPIKISETLENRRVNLLPPPKYDDDFEIVDDRRTNLSFKISIIVSLYNAANKLDFFLKHLNQQSLVQTGNAEIIFVDSGSPTNEYKIFLQLIASLKIQVLYIRTKSRETIQKAWNRGIKLAKAPYLTFLGVDEGICPDALNILAKELDDYPSVDWVQSNSLSTSVTENGSWVEDVMIYERSGFHLFHIYLETCYISWVGALYRRSIHDRFGYYDDTFRAAGDTEFKNRVGPFVKMKTLPLTLGIFFNYPEERATQSPTAELEDLRAWYLYRSIQGMEYVLKNKDQTFAEEALLLCLKYRKSYCNHWSTDIELAYSVGVYIKKNYPNSKFSDLHDKLLALKDGFNAYDNDGFSSAENMLVAKRTFNHARKALNIELTKIGFPDSAFFHYSNDNRYEQHQGFW